MNDKVRTINIDGIEVQTSLTPLELADLSQKYAELQSNWNSLFEYAKQQLEKAFDKVEQDTWEEVLEYMNELEGKKKQ